VVDALGVNFGAALKAAREEAQLLQTEFAEKADLEKSYVSQLENNRKSPTLSTYFRICAVFGVKPSAFMKRVEETPAPRAAANVPKKRRGG
jgi:transcriptional regulator with XRE-family HTH domain